MSDRVRRRDLRARLLPHGTHLADVPPDHAGLTVREWEELRWLESKALAEKKPRQDYMRFQPVSTSRDNYGWRSLPGGSRFIG